jgi:hypothetical protein
MPSHASGVGLSDLCDDLDAMWDTDKPVWNYSFVMQHTLQALWRVLDRHCGSYIPNLKNLAVTVASVQPSGDPFMVPYETSFEANSTARAISYPDPFVLHEAHVKEMMHRHALVSRDCRSDRTF